METICEPKDSIRIVCYVFDCVIIIKEIRLFLFFKRECDSSLLDRIHYESISLTLTSLIAPLFIHWYWYNRLRCTSQMFLWQLCSHHTVYYSLLHFRYFFILYFSLLISFRNFLKQLLQILYFSSMTTHPNKCRGNFWIKGSQKSKYGRY